MKKGRFSFFDKDVEKAEYPCKWKKQNLYLTLYRPINSKRIKHLNVTAQPVLFLTADTEQSFMMLDWAMISWLYSKSIGNSTKKKIDRLYLMKIRSFFACKDVIYLWPRNCYLDTCTKHLKSSFGDITTLLFKCSNIYNAEICKLSVHLAWRNKEYVVCAHSGICWAWKRESVIPVAWINLVEWTKANPGREIMHELSHMWNLKHTEIMKCRAEWRLGAFGQ